MAPIWSFTGTQSGQYLNHPQNSPSAKAKQGNALTCFSPQTVYKNPFCWLFSASVFCIFVLLIDDLATYKTAPKHKFQSTRKL